jgi:hypothetical protein
MIAPAGVEGIQSLRDLLVDEARRRGDGKQLPFLDMTVYGREGRTRRLHLQQRARELQSSRTLLHVLRSQTGPLLKCLKLLGISAFWGGPEGPGSGSIRRE